MNADQLRALQAPLKEQYRAAPETALVTLRAQGQLGVCSYYGPDQPAIGENNPWLAYQDLMGLSNLDEVALARLTARRESVLDLVEADFSRLQAANLGAADRAKLDMHLTAVRDPRVPGKAAAR